jgi:hypothetical protein
LRAARTVLPGENEEDFYQLCADLEVEWQPETRTQQILLEEMAVAHWKLARIESLEGKIMLKPLGNKEQMALLVQIFQQQSRLKNSFLKSMHELQRLQKSSAVQPDQPAPAVTEVATESATEAMERLRPIAVPPSGTEYRAAGADEAPFTVLAASPYLPPPA